MAPSTVSRTTTISQTYYEAEENYVEVRKLKNIEENRGRKLFIYQIVTFIVLFASYATYNLGRKSVSYVAPTLLATGLLNQNGVGILGSSQNTAYAISKFIAGVMSDKISAKRLLSLGLLLSGVSALGVATCDNTNLWYLLWFVNGLAQGCGWPACSKMLKKWYGSKYFGTCWSLLSASSNVAGSVGPIFSAFLIINYSWRIALLATGCISIAMALASVILLTDHPADVGLTIDRNCSKTLSSSNTASATMTWRELVSSPLLWTVAACYLVVFGIKTALTDWSQVFLMQELGQGQLQASAFISCLEAGGFFGGIMSGIITDKLQRRILGINPRLFVASAFVIGTISGLHAMASIFSPESSQTFTSIVAFILGASLFGPIAIFGIVASESFPQSISGTAHAIVALAANVGAILAGWPLGMMVSVYQWTSAFFLMEGFAVAVVMLIYLSSQIRTKSKKE